MNRRAKILMAALALLLATTTVVLAQSGGDVDLRWHVFGDGGVITASGGNVTLSGTLGQTTAGQSVGGVVTLHGGFWYEEEPLQLFLPILKR